MDMVCPKCREKIPDDAEVTISIGISSSGSPTSMRLTCPNCQAELTAVGGGLVPVGGKPASAPASSSGGSADTSHLKSTSGFSGKEVGILVLIGLGIVVAYFVLKMLNVF
jgi:hypothetical protein